MVTIPTMFLSPCGPGRNSILDTDRRPYNYPDWTHTNAILYSPDDGSHIISIRHQNWLLKIDYGNGAGAGDILWHLGYQGDFALLNADGSTDSDSTDWFYAQHVPIVRLQKHVRQILLDSFR